MIAIELKAPGNYCTPAQVRFLTAVKARGWLTAVCPTLDEFTDVLRHVRPHNGRRLA